jgi:acyl carrier protein
MMNIEALVHEKVLSVVRLRRPNAQAVTTDQELRGDLGLDSLDLAQLGAELETALEVSIFEDVAVGAILTIGDLTTICEETLAKKSKRAS